MRSISDLRTPLHNMAPIGNPSTNAYGREGLLVVDLDLEPATRLLATRCKIEEYAT